MTHDPPALHCVCCIWSCCGGSTPSYCYRRCWLSVLSCLPSSLSYLNPLAQCANQKSSLVLKCSMELTAHWHDPKMRKAPDASSSSSDGRHTGSSQQSRPHGIPTKVQRVCGGCTGSVWSGRLSALFPLSGCGDVRLCTIQVVLLTWSSASTWPGDSRKIPSGDSSGPMALNRAMLECVSRRRCWCTSDQV